MEDGSDLEEGEIAEERFSDEEADEQDVATRPEIKGHDLNGGHQGGMDGKTKPLKRRKLKKQRKLVQAGKGSRQDYFDVYGPEARAQATLTEPERGSVALKVQDLQQLTTWTFGDGLAPKWVFVKNKPLVEKVVLIFAAGLDATLFSKREDLFPNLLASFGVPRKVAGLGAIADTAAVAGTLLSVPSSKKRKERDNDKEQVNGGPRKRQHQDSHRGGPSAGLGRVVKRLRREKDDQAQPQEPADKGSVGPEKVINRTGTSPFPPSYYVLTDTELRENQFPFLQQQEDGSLPEPPPGFVVSKAEETLPDASKVQQIVAIDCEMCYTSQGLELTRISAVNNANAVLLDKFVKPSNPITDYNTQYSGITPELLENVSTSLQDIQEELLTYVAAETMLVGHSLNSDLTALKVIHLRCIDTSLLYSHPKGPPYKPALRVLAERFLNRSIQGGTSGHDSVEDARATMDLTLLKIQNGPSFGEPRGVQGDSLIALLGQKGRRCVLLDRRRLLHRFAVGSSSAIICTSDSEVAAKTAKEVQKPVNDFVWCRFAELSSHYEEVSRDATVVATKAAEMSALLTCSGEAALAPPVSPALEEILRRLDARVKSIFEAANPNTLMMLATGHGDTAIVRRVQELKWKRLAGAALGGEKWDEASEKVLSTLCDRAKAGLVVVTVKQ